jgi:hypothetical protein
MAIMDLRCMVGMRSKTGARVFLLKCLEDLKKNLIKVFNKGRAWLMDPLPYTSLSSAKAKGERVV